MVYICYIEIEPFENMEDKTLVIWYELLSTQDFVFSSHKSYLPKYLSTFIKRYYKW